MCLCLSALPLFLQTNVLAILAESLVGEADITAILTALVRTFSYLKHAKQTLTLVKIESSPHVPACPSGGGLRKRDFNYWEKHASCPSGLDACGVFGGSARAFECVDTRVDLESCKLYHKVFSFLAVMKLMVFCRWWMCLPHQPQRWPRRPGLHCYSRCL